MARTREFDETEVLDSAMRVFWENGFDGTSMQDLEQAMGLKRTSIYNAFGNKRDIFNQALVHYMETLGSCWNPILEEADTAREGIQNLLNKLLDLHFDEDSPGGCLLTLAALERSQHDTVSQEIIEQAMHTLGETVYQRLVRGKKAGEFGQDFDTRGTATVITSIFSGFMVLGKANFSKSAMHKAVLASLKLLD